MKASLALGTAQFGKDYGISNSSGQVKPSEVARILSAAVTAGVSVLDTAAAYGDSETVIGKIGIERFRIVTKSPMFDEQPLTDFHASILEKTFHQSLCRLRLNKCYGLLIHNSNDLLVDGGERLYDAMTRLKSAGLVQKIGASVYEGSQIDALLNRYELDIVQLPLNALDQRLIRGGEIERLNRHGVEVHARSVFLQGLLLMDPDTTPKYFGPIRPLLRRWRFAAEARGMTPLEAALAFVRDTPGVHTVVVGVTTYDQLHACREAMRKNTAYAAEELICEDPKFLNPSNWQFSA